MEKDRDERAPACSGVKQFTHIDESAVTVACESLDADHGGAIQHPERGMQNESQVLRSLLQQETL